MTRIARCLHEVSGGSFICLISTWTYKLKLQIVEGAIEILLGDRQE